MALCKPAHAYLAISILALLIMYFQNAANVDMYCIGTYSCGVYSTSLVFLVKIVYILFWTWLLNLICDEFNPTYAWFLVIFPFMLMFGAIALVLLNNVSTVYQSFSVHDLYNQDRTWRGFYDYFIGSNWYLQQNVTGAGSYINPVNYLPQNLKPY